MGFVLLGGAKLHIVCNTHSVQFEGFWVGIVREWDER